MKSIFRITTLFVVIAAVASAQFIYSNGPLATHPAGGCAVVPPGDACALQNTGTNPMNILGFAGQGAAGVRNADDFVVPCGEVWTINTIKVFGYQTGAVAPSMISGNYRIWTGQPGGTGTILFDFSAANQMTANAFSNNYRATVTALLGCTRRIQEVTMAGNGITLIAGTYWLDWSYAGSLASGPFQPPITILGQTNTGNAINFNGLWAPTTDPGTAAIPGVYPQGMPFEIDHATTLIGCFQLNITQAGPGGTVTLADTGGLPGLTAFNVITLNQGGFPNDWFFGVGIPLPELGNLLSSGPPFIVPLPGTGAFSISTAYTLGIPITIYYVGLMLSGSTLVTADAAKTVTLLP